MKLDPDDIYLRLGHLVAEMPEFDAPGVVTREMNDWLAQTLALVELVASASDVSIMKSAMYHLNGSLRQTNAQTIVSIVLSTLARAELQASPEAQGRFIPAASPHQAFVAVGNVLRLAKTEVLIVDPYADSSALTDFAIQADEGVMIRLLTDATKKKGNLDPAIAAWRSQYGDKRPLTAALAQPRSLHDRIIAVDGNEVWTIGQSLNGIGKMAPTAILKVPSDTAREKLEAYEAIWRAAEQI